MNVVEVSACSIEFIVIFIEWRVQQEDEEEVLIEHKMWIVKIIMVFVSAETKE